MLFAWQTQNLDINLQVTAGWNMTHIAGPATSLGFLSQKQLLLPGQCIELMLT